MEIDRAACFLGLESPAGHTWHSNGTPPKTDANRGEMVGNHSAVAVEGRDAEARQRPELLRPFHVPGFARKRDGHRVIRNQGAVIDGSFSPRVVFGGR